MKKFKRILALSLALLMLMSTFITFPATAVTTTSEPVSADTTAESVSAESTAEPVSAETQSAGTVLAYFDFENENCTDGGNAKATVKGGISFVDHDGGKAAVFNYGEQDWLDIKKNNGGFLLTEEDNSTIYNNLTISYDISYSDNSNTTWIYFSAPFEDGQEGNEEHYIGSVIPKDGKQYIEAERYDNNGSRPVNAMTGDLNKNQWYHIDVVYTGNATAIYVDGKQVSKKISNYTLSEIFDANNKFNKNNSRIFQIGKGNWGDGEYTTMQLDNFKVVGYQSTETELAYFNFDDEANWTNGGNAKATVGGGSIDLAVRENGGNAAVFNYGEKDWLDIKKNDNSPLLNKTDNSMVYENIKISYDFLYKTNSNVTWVYYAAKSRDNQYNIGDKYISSVIAPNGTKINAERYNGSSPRPTIATTEDLTDNNWYHIDVVYTENATSIYVDGKQVSHVSSNFKLSDILLNDSVFQIGKGNWDSGEYSTMQLDNFKVVGYETNPDMLADMLTLPYSTETGKEVYGNITLPTSIDGMGSVTWTTNHPDIVASDGKVIRPDTDTVVTATATITVNGNTTKKEFQFTVKEKPKEINESDYTDYFFAYFTGEQYSDGEQVYFATSQDGLNWKNINNNTPSLKSTIGKQGVRDPFIIRSPEGDKFYLLGTDARHNVLGWGNFSTSIIVWESTDLINWTNQRLINVDPNSEFGCAWAPEAFYDDATNQYVVFWASYLKTDPNAGQTNTELMHFSIYYSTTRDFYTFSAPKLYLDKEGSIIDTTMIKGVDNRIYRFTKNESTAEQTIDGKVIPPKSVFVEVGSSVLSNDFTVIESTSLAAYNNSNKPVEGPAIFKLNNDDVKTSATDTTNRWCLLLDNFAGGGYFPLTTDTLSQANFTAVDSGKYSMPGAGYRPAHGTPIPITTEEYNAIMAAASKNTDTHAKFDIDAVNVLDNNANTILLYPKKFFDAKINAPGKNLNDMFTTLPDGFSWSDWTAFRIEKRGDETGGLRYTVIETVNGANGGNLGVDKNDSFILLVKNSYFSRL